MAADRDLEQSDYRALAEFRYQIRRFLRFSEQAARKAGIEPQQHQLMLAVKGLPDGVMATVGELANRLQIQHHSTVELVNRLEDQGLVSRKRGDEDRRQVEVLLTSKGERVLRELSLFHRSELRASGPELAAALRRLLAATGRGRRAEPAERSVAARQKTS